MPEANLVGTTMRLLEKEGFFRGEGACACRGKGVWGRGWVDEAREEK